VAGVRFCYVSEEDTTIDSIAFDQAALPSGIDRAVAVARPGAVVSPPPRGTVWGRVAYLTALGSSIDDCRTTLDQAEQALHIVAR
jgi:hypothetical protein